MASLRNKLQDEEKEGEISGVMAQNMIVPVDKQLI